ncbi:MAG: hypothetical protein ACREYE_05875 [Gammaproteobacteria bacterium]
MAITRKAFGQLAEAILEGGAKKATKYFSPREVLKATLQGKRDRRNTRNTILFTYGVPNYQEQVFIRAALAADEPFPIKKIQLKFEREAR